MGPTAALLSGGTRLHLQHGPIDLIIGAEGEKEAAFAAAKARFATVLDELVAELADLKKPLTQRAPRPRGDIARRMHDAALPFSDLYVTRMASVAGSVADTILQAMTIKAKLTRVYVNNGGDIALHLTEGHSFTTAIASHAGVGLGEIRIQHGDPVRGIATSGRHGRSHSLGVADSVTVLAKTAAAADVAATLIANAVDLPDHPAITRVPAATLDDTSDLGDQEVVTSVGILTSQDIECALANGAERAAQYRAAGHIIGASLHLGGLSRTVGATEELEYA